MNKKYLGYDGDLVRDFYANFEYSNVDRVHMHDKEVDFSPLSISKFLRVPHMIPKGSTVLPLLTDSTTPIPDAISHVLTYNHPMFPKYGNWRISRHDLGRNSRIL